MDVQRLVFPRQRSPRPKPAALHRDPGFRECDLAAVRRMRKGLSDEEARVSYWRRIIQARIDLLKSKERPGASGERLSRILADSRVSHRRIAALSVDSVDELPPLPDLAALWERVVPTDADEKAALIAALSEAETRLSDYRHELHHRIDRVTAELIARYRENPALALTALHERLADL